MLHCVNERSGGYVRRVLHWIVAAVVLGLLLVPTARALDARQFAAVLRDSDFLLVAGAALLSLTGCMGAASLRLGSLLAALPVARRLSAGRLYAIYLASSAAQHLLPAPSSEILRAVHLSRRHGYSIEDVTAAHLVEKAVDATVLSGGVLLLVLFGQLPAAMQRPVSIFSAVVAVAVALVAVLMSRSSGKVETASPTGERIFERVRLFLRRTFSSIGRLRSPSTWLISVGWSCISEGANALVAGLILLSVGQPSPSGIWLAVALTARLSGVVPLTPGQLGVQEGSVALVLGAFGIEPSRAMAAALLYRAVHSLPIIVVGGLALRTIVMEPKSVVSQAGN